MDHACPPRKGVERAVRKAIAPAVELAGLYAGRPAKPTGRLVFEALASLLELLNVDPTRPRWAS